VLTPGDWREGNEEANCWDCFVGRRDRGPVGRTGAEAGGKLKLPVDNVGVLAVYNGADCIYSVEFTSGLSGVNYDIDLDYTTSTAQALTVHLTDYRAKGKGPYTVEMLGASQAVYISAVTVTAKDQKGKTVDSVTAYDGGNVGPFLVQSGETFCFALP